MSDRFSKFAVLRFLSASLLLLSALLAHAAGSRRVIIYSSGSRQELKQRVQALGGKVQREFDNVTAVSATVPEGALSALHAVAGYKVRKSAAVLAPVTRGPRGLAGQVRVASAGHLKFDQATIIKNAQTKPSDYLFNNALINAAGLQAAGYLGQDAIVAIIDSGTANNPDVVFSLDGAVIGGESFVPSSEDPVTSATSTKNGDHGTWVGTMIAGNTAFLLPNTSCLARSVQFNAPDSIFDGTPYGYAGYQVLPLVGVAPAAKLYALKVFPSTGDSAADDRIIAAMDRAITLKKNFLAGKPSVPVSGSGTEDDPYVYDSLNIQVVNMSLGGPTQAAGRDVEDLLAQQMLKVGITLATSAGNAGPALLTTGSPSTGLGSISSAAADVPAHERIYWDVAGASSCAVGLGALARPTDTIQTAYFSSRGPTADGRVGVDVTSAGYFNFVQSADGSLSLVAGTSFTAPTVAGAAALLRSALPKASAIETRNALVLGANPRVLDDKSGAVEQGAGYLDVARSLDLLQRRKVSNRLPAFPFYFGEVGLNALKFGIVPSFLFPGVPLKFNVKNVLPGETREFLVRVGAGRSQVQVSINSVTPKLSADQQNQLFGDDIFFAVHQAKTSSFGEGDYPIQDFVGSPATYTIDDPEPGYMRVVIMGDWTNAGPVAASVTLTASNVGTPVFSRSRKIAEGDQHSYTLNVPSGWTSLHAELTWDNDWSHYPTNDLDLILIDPNGNVNIDGATLNGREIADIPSPTPGQWTVVVDGFDIFGKLLDDGSERGPQTDVYRLTVYPQ
jgi:hypothetical protein